MAALPGQTESNNSSSDSQEVNGGGENNNISLVEAASEQAVTWAVTLPCEAVLFFDSLNDFFTDQGKVHAVNDINE